MAEIQRVVPKTLDEVKELYKQGNISLDLKPISDLSLKCGIIKYALTLEDLEDPIMILNIINLIKVYNTLDDTFFTAPDIYVNSVEELLDLKLSIMTELKQFTRLLSVYLLSLMKSYNKLTYTPADEHKDLPKIFAAIFLTIDLSTICGIFAKAGTISTDELMFIDNAYMYVNMLTTKNLQSVDLINAFYKSMELQNA